MLQKYVNIYGDRQLCVLCSKHSVNLLQISIDFVLDESNHNVNPQYQANTYVYLTSSFLLLWSGLSGVNVSHRGCSGRFIFIPQYNDTMCFHYHVLPLHWYNPCTARKILTRVHSTNVYLSAFCFPTQSNCIVRWSTIVPKYKVGIMATDHWGNMQADGQVSAVRSRFCWQPRGFCSVCYVLSVLQLETVKQYLMRFYIEWKALYAPQCAFQFEFLTSSLIFS
jgi:hypothetical protein